MASVLSHIVRIPFRPRRTFERILAEPRKTSKGFRILVLTGILFALSSAALAVAGALLPAPAFIPLPSYDYYVYQTLFALPVVLAAWVAAAAAAQLASAAAGGRGSFRGLLACSAFAFAAPSVLMGLSQAAYAGLLLLGMSQEEFMELTADPGPWQSAALAYAAAAFLLLVLLSTKAAASARGLSVRRALPAGLLAAAVYVAVLAGFLR